MQLSQVSISAEGTLLNYDQPFSYEAFKIVLVDDHRLFAEGLQKSVIRFYLPNADVTVFANGDEADVYIRKQISLREKIDVLITDVNHPGISGITLAVLTRFYEKEYGSEFRIPIVILSMADLDLMKSSQPEVNGSIDYVLAKSAPVEEIAAVLFAVVS